MCDDSCLIRTHVHLSSLIIIIMKEVKHTTLMLALATIYNQNRTSLLNI
ncbi:1782_t:CDS:2 [Racocetra fulgida]|uniref:1782_t:CDS:1 n=1 Tax=Racocetra fulgida TaxID=60492 RepID=A0A9N8ZMQ1_9GLOM|nr:1782_t:CDS:2 [Racocetra fulgida]